MMTNRRNSFMPFLLVAAIGMAFTLPYPMNIIQASVASLSLGAKLMRMLDDK